MILPFSTRINDKPSYFIEKIWIGLVDNKLAPIRAYFDHRALFKSKFGYDWDMLPGEIVTKIHTMRVDARVRWHDKLNIRFYVNNRSKNAFQFAPIVPCVSVQLDTQFFVPVREGSLMVVQGRVKHRASSLMFVTGELSVDGKPCASAEAIINILAPRT